MSYEIQSESIRGSVDWLGPDGCWYTLDYTATIDGDTTPEAQIDGRPCGMTEYIWSEHWEEMEEACQKDLDGFTGKGKSEWISVKDRLPPDEPSDEITGVSVDVLVTDGKEVQTGYHDGRDGRDIWVMYHISAMRTPTHWMPLPDPPKGEG